MNRVLRRLVNGAHNVSATVITLTNCQTVNESRGCLRNYHRNA
jgi:hypothetical protein